MALGQVDIEDLVEKNLRDVDDWDKNFRSLKLKARDAEKLPNEIKVDCFIVSTSPIKSAIEESIQKLNDSMVYHLKRAISENVKQIDTFLTGGIEILSTRPQTHEEIGEAYKKHSELYRNRKSMIPVLENAEAKNKLLRSVAGGGHEQLFQLQVKMDKFQVMIESHQQVLKDQTEVLRKNLKSRIDSFQQDIEKMAARWHQFKPKERDMEDEAKCIEALEKVKERDTEVQEYMKTAQKIQEECRNFQMDEPQFKELQEIHEEIGKIKSVWGVYEEFQSGIREFAKEDWVSFRSKTYKFDEYLQFWQDKLKKEQQAAAAKSSSGNNKPSMMQLKIQSDIDTYRDLVPCLKWVRGEALSPEHWLDLFRMLKMPKGTSLERLTFGDLIKVKAEIIKNSEWLKELNLRAQSEHSIREALRELELWSAGAQFALTEYQDSKQTKVAIIKDWKDLFSQVGDNQALLSSLKDSQYYKHFEDKIVVWEQKLGTLDECLHNLNQVQRKWVYLEPIFGRGALPKEQSRFKGVDRDFRDIMGDVVKDTRVISLISSKDISSKLKNMVDQLQRCQKALNEFLEEKRSVFPRFYFIGDDDLLEILGQATNPVVIQTHLKKLFAGIHQVKFDEKNENIVAMRSLEGEVVPLVNKVKLSHSVESWLDDLSKEMVNTLQRLLIQILQESRRELGNYSVDRYPSQILCLAESIAFTERCERALASGGGAELQQLHRNLKTILEKYTSVDYGKSSNSQLLELKYKALIMDVIHYVDVVEQLMNENCRSPNDWPWQRQLRFYLNKKDIAIIRMVDAEFFYTYEYQGNAPKLVHTPLTDKCYLTLTQGMHMGFGGNPYGPAGTGKTESVKALGGLFGRQVLVFNCDEGIDVKSIGRIFVGICKCGAWGCFDEFNRLDEAVLSAVSMQIQVIQDSLRSRSGKTILLEKEIDINNNSGIFVTLNPAGKGYGGRSKLPDNLKQLFRPVAMTKPDNDLIAEVILYSEGFKEAKHLGRKLVALFTLSRQLLSTQQHYDWGLRALKTVLKSCGSLLHQTKRQSGENAGIDAAKETEIIVKAARFNTMSKLTFADSKRFDSLLKDIFPNVKITEFEYEELKKALAQVFQENKLIFNKIQLKKALEVYEQLRQRMGVVVVGPSGSGKSVLWRMLKEALIKTGKMVKTHVMNPKAINRSQLLGHIDVDTREWTDGVLTAASRQVIKEPVEVQSWIVCDGDIDPEWVESLNSVLDDNRLLTMPSGDRIQFGPNVNFLFETDDLSCASPATISRMGMIFLSDEDTDVKAIVDSWLHVEPEETRSDTEKLINQYFFTAFEWIMNRHEFLVSTSLVGTVLNGLSHLRGIKDKTHFAVGLIRGFGGNLPEATLNEFAKTVLKMTGDSGSDSDMAFNITYDLRADCIRSYVNEEPSSSNHEAVNNPSQLPIVKTIQLQRGVDGIMPWLDSKSRTPFLLIGPDGCGKSLVLRQCFTDLRSTQVAVVHCSAQTNPTHILQKLAQTCIQVSSISGRVYKPKECENLILFLKDINLPKPDKWGTSQLITFLQQLITYNGFYDEALEFVRLENIQLVGSMNPNITIGRHKLPSRFTSIVRVFSISYPTDEELKLIYSTYLRSIISSNMEKHPKWGSSSNTYQLASSMVTLYSQVLNKFSRDSHSHYLFTPRELTNWCLSLLRYNLAEMKNDSSTDSLLQVWAYEACRIFHDRLVDKDARKQFMAILSGVLSDEWRANSLLTKLDDCFYISWANSTVSSGAGRLPPFGKPLDGVKAEFIENMLVKAINRFNAEYYELRALPFEELLENVSRFDRVLTAPGGSLLLCGRSGVGRRTALAIASSMNNMKIYTPKINKSYGVKQFKNDLKQVLQQAGIEGQQMIILLEDHQLVDPSFLEMINSLLSAGEIPGLYNPEELEPMLAPIREDWSQENFRGTVLQYFAKRIKTNLHVVLIMDYSNPNFSLNCESNPAFYKECSVQWLERWSKKTMIKAPTLMLQIESEFTGKDIFSQFYEIHMSVYDKDPKTSSTRHYMKLINTFRAIFNKKRSKVIERQRHLKNGVSKLNDAKTVVNELEKKAKVQREKLAEKQSEADRALNAITHSMQGAGEQKIEMEELKVKIEAENKTIAQRKEAIEEELKEVQPIVDEAKKAVGQIKPESLTEIRSLRAPPDAVRDILEGVMFLMGNKDSSWAGIKSFLGRRGIKEEILNFNPRTIMPENRQDVEKLLKKNGNSFELDVARRASAAAAPLAQWVKANVQFSKILEKIMPLEEEQNKLKKSLEKVTTKMKTVGGELSRVDERVAQLRKTFEETTQEAAKLRIELEKAEETMSSAQNLVGKLENEYHRWNKQVDELQKQLDQLPKLCLLSAAFITYLSAKPEDERTSFLKEWSKTLGIDEKYDLRKFLCTESELLTWKSEGLPSDQLSVENSIVILEVI